MGQAPCRRPPKVDFGESILETGNSRLENCVSETHFLDEKVIQNPSWEGLWEVWGGSWEVFGRLLVSGWCLGGSGGVSGSIFGGSWTDLGVKME